MLFTQKASWVAAEEHCLEIGGHLVAIKSLAEQDAVAQLVALHTQSNYIFIGATDVEQEARWMWSDGERMGYSNWGPGEPNNGGTGEHCAVIATVEYKWDDLGCDGTRTYICER